ncbi:class A beta-lactamase [Jiella sp. MQZ9-1]|uniref:Beta-lactamase n=1 Tax=Jiella flava TaxID=2816857 RepID=A0A939JVI7_9HYPH|nr:class A beta-lactamase [Jiella flava]MBO0662509.1 class A beta-lactamase [Jiella flava]MCD2471734.1 class A beta-lactamase [Jiella flava]
MNRRDLLIGSTVSAATLAFRPTRPLAANASTAKRWLAALEDKHGGRLGVAILDTGNGRQVAHRGDERFLICSTFKFLLVAAVLARVDHAKEELDRRIVFNKGALLDWAPVTQLNVGSPGMTFGQLCEAATIMSDNTAANLLLETMGGPPAITAYARTLGDTKTRLDQREPLNAQSQGEEDTTTPASMIDNMRTVLLGNALSKTSRDRLAGWMTTNQTGAQSLRAGLPLDWRIADKTGAARVINNDIAVVWPPDRAPMIVAAYYRAENHDAARRKAVLADVGKIVAKWSR